MWEFLPEARYIGEVGLDFVDTTYKNEQIAFFNELIERCRFDRDKIITIHSRRAVRQVLRIIGNNYRFKPILHWFTGSNDEILEAVDAGFYFSINGAMMTSKRFLALLPLIPKERLLLETDSPFTYCQKTHSHTLDNIMRLIKKEKENVDLWCNLKTILS